GRCQPDRVLAELDDLVPAGAQPAAGSADRLVVAVPSLAILRRRRARSGPAGPFRGPEHDADLKRLVNPVHSSPESTVYAFGVPNSSPGRRPGAEHHPAVARLGDASQPAEPAHHIVRRSIQPVT